MYKSITTVTVIYMSSSGNLGGCGQAMDRTVAMMAVTGPLAWDAASGWAADASQ
jgi:hypothetical protein